MLWIFGIAVVGFLYLGWVFLMVLNEISNSLNEFQRNFNENLKHMQRDLKLISESLNDSSDWNKKKTNG